MFLTHSFDYNPDTRVCCIPLKDEPAVPSYNRYTIDFKASCELRAGGVWDSEKKVCNNPSSLSSGRRLVGGGKIDWQASVDAQLTPDVDNNKCGKLPESHGLFEMAEHLDYLPVAGTMAFIVVFTIFCEQSLALSKSWVEYFNPLLQPCVDKVCAELMILGATAFLILIVNEVTGYALSDGRIMPTDW